MRGVTLVRRIHKPTLRQYGITQPAIDTTTLQASECQYRAEQLAAALQGMDEAAADEVFVAWAGAQMRTASPLWFGSGACPFDTAA